MNASPLGRQTIGSMKMSKRSTPVPKVSTRKSNHSGAFLLDNTLFFPLFQGIKSFTAIGTNDACVVSETGPWAHVARRASSHQVYEHCVGNGFRRPLSHTIPGDCHDLPLFARQSPSYSATNTRTSPRAVRLHAGRNDGGDRDYRDAWPASCCRRSSRPETRGGVRRARTISSRSAWRCSLSRTR